MGDRLRRLPYFWLEEEDFFLIPVENVNFLAQVISIDKNVALCKTVHNGWIGVITFEKNQMVTLVKNFLSLPLDLSLIGDDDAV